MLVLGIHIEDYGVYTLALEAKLSSYEIKSHTFSPLSLEESDDSKNLQIAILLNKNLEKYPPKYYSYVLSTSSHLMSIQDFQFPFTEKFKINQTLPHQIESILPISLKDIVCDSKIAYQKEKTSHVLACISSKQRMEELIQPLEVLKPYNYTVTPMGIALTNLFEDWQSSPPSFEPGEDIKADQLALHLSYRESTLLVLYKNRTIHSFHLNWGIDSIVEDIAAKYKRTLSQAMDYFYENAFLSKDTPELESLVPLSNIVKKSFDQLAQQMRLIMIDLESKGYHSIKDIILLGPGCRIQNLTYHLFNQFKIPVHRVELHPKLEDARFMPVLGVAIEGLKRARNPSINMIKHRQSSNSSSSAFLLKKRLLIQGLALIIIASSYLLMRDWQTNQLNKQISQVFISMSRKVAGFKIKDISLEKLNKFINSEKSNQEQARSFSYLNQAPFAINYLEKLSLSLNKKSEWNLEVTELDINGRSVLISGSIAPSFIKEFNQNLKQVAENGIIQPVSAPNKGRILPIQKKEKAPQAQNQPDKEKAPQAQNQPDKEKDKEKEMTFFSFKFTIKT